MDIEDAKKSMPVVTGVLNSIYDLGSRQLYDQYLRNKNKPYIKARTLIDLQMSCEFTKMKGQPQEFQQVKGVHGLGEFPKADWVLEADLEPPCPDSHVPLNLKNKPKAPDLSLDLN